MDKLFLNWNSSKRNGIGNTNPLFITCHPVHLFNDYYVNYFAILYIAAVTTINGIQSIKRSSNMGWILEPATLNVLQLGLGFFVNFLAFNSQGFIEEPVIESVANRGIINKHAGYYSLSIIYAVFTLANFVAAPIVDVLRPKWAMVTGALCYTAFQVNCNEHTTRRNSALLWGLAEGSLAGGGLFLFFVFNQTNTSDNITDGTVHLMYTVFTALSLMAAVIFAFLRTPPKLSAKPQNKILYGELMTSTFRLMFTKKMIMLSFVFAYTGIEQSFWTGIYPTCISFTKRLGSNTNSLVALNSIATGVGQVTAGLLFGILGNRTRKIGRDSIVLFGTTIHLAVFAAIYINFPIEASLKKTDAIGGLMEPNVAVALICGCFLGFGDACWNTQIYSLLCDTYPNKSSQAFALFKFYQSALSCAAFYYSSLIELPWHLAILVISSLVASVAFFGVERIRKENSAVSDKTVKRNDRSNPLSPGSSSDLPDFLHAGTRAWSFSDFEMNEEFPPPPLEANLGRTAL
uniref:UNC93-like protein MFSD11 n=1 Tax=Heterorhabditis bacteriophora TaxID=37862 RepID=A0A1I7XGB1_HETBA